LRIKNRREKGEKADPECMGTVPLAAAKKKGGDGQSGNIQPRRESAPEEKRKGRQDKKKREKKKGGRMLRNAIRRRGFENTGGRRGRNVRGGGSRPLTKMTLSCPENYDGLRTRKGFGEISRLREHGGKQKIDTQDRESESSTPNKGIKAGKTLIERLAEGAAESCMGRRAYVIDTLSVRYKAER